MPAKAGIQSNVNSFEARSLDPGVRRGDESIFNSLLEVIIAILAKVAVQRGL